MSFSWGNIERQGQRSMEDCCPWPMLQEWWALIRNQVCQLRLSSSLPLQRSTLPTQWDDRVENNTHTAMNDEWPLSNDQNTHTVFDCIFLFLLTLIAVHFHTQVVSALLPVKAAVFDCEQIFLCQRVARGNLYQHHTCRRVTLFRRPVRNHIVSGGPGEIPAIQNMLVLR